jgi:hypothetical protein
MLLAVNSAILRDEKPMNLVEIAGVSGEQTASMFRVEKRKDAIRGQRQFDSPCS